MFGLKIPIYSELIILNKMKSVLSNEGASGKLAVNPCWHGPLSELPDETIDAISTYG